nr:MAG TPA: hypothetical protein [Caudoviricetes sp.]
MTYLFGMCYNSLGLKGNIGRRKTACGFVHY